ncbi:hypothetical protein CTAYLR_002121 [Chrysophaeum taylorii]|uniref:Uncharacterized protein n=1 Tax=Chrysophaeum taylorii TaxID=2483200 RepID=A0AAD7XMU1_9STRA|nr:hypothetical protein CTAYLR_002121 [Chrysophaeum taylorii]
MAAFDPADAGACFAELKRHLDLPEAQNTIPIPLDELFEEAFDLCFKVHPSSLSPEARAAFFNNLNRNQNGRVSFVEWRLFHRQWRASRESMADYLASLPTSGALTSSTPTHDQKIATTIETDAPKEEDYGTGTVEGRVEGIQALSGLGAAVIAMEAQEAPAITVDGRGSGGAEVGLLDGIRFELKLAFPIEFAWRILKNAVIKYGGGDETRDMIIASLKEDTEKIIASLKEDTRTIIASLKEDTQTTIEDLKVLRTAKLSAVSDMLESLLEKYELLALSISSSDELRKSDDFRRLRDDAVSVRNLATEAFRTVPNKEQKVHAVKIAMIATAIGYGLGASAVEAHVELKHEVEKLLGDESIKRAINTQLKGGAGAFSFGSRDDREKLICDILVLVLREHSFAVTHGFRDRESVEPILHSKSIIEFLLNRNGTGYLRTLGKERLELFTADFPTLGTPHFSVLKSFESSGVEDAARKAEIIVGIRNDTNLDLSSKNIGDEGAVAISAGLEKNTTLQSLGLPSNRIGDEGARALSQMLSKNTTLRILELNSNRIGDEGARALSQMLSKNTTLRILGLSNNHIGDEGARALSQMLSKNTTLQTLWLNSNRIGDEGARALSQMLSKNTTLRILELNSNRIGDEGARALSQMLSKNTTLRILGLSNNHIGDEGARALSQMLSKNTTLQTLWLNSNRIGDEGARALSQMLSKNTTLQKLWLDNNHIGDEGARALSQMLSKNTTLQTLVLSHNRIGDEGARALSQMLSKNTTLQTLGLSNNNITDAAARTSLRAAAGPSLKLFL